MEATEYQKYKSWLAKENMLSNCPDAVNYLFAINRFLQKRITGIDRGLFELIEQQDFSTIFRARQHYTYQRLSKKDPNYDYVIRTSFEYLRLSYDRYEEFEASRILKNHSSLHTLYVHQGNIVCLKYKHPIEDVTAQIAVAADTPLRIHASRCVKCNCTFITKSFYLELRKRHRFMVANFCELSADGYTPVKQNSLSAESPLMLCGYSVKHGGLSDNDRQLLLADIIHNGILSKTEIILYLEHFISFNGSRDGLLSSVLKWETDLEFVRSLDFPSHPTVSIGEIMPYSRKKIKDKIIHCE